MKKNVGPLQTEHTCSGICHQSVIGLWGSADSINLAPLFYECSDEAWSLAVAIGMALFGDPAAWILAFVWIWNAVLLLQHFLKSFLGC